MKRRWVLFFTFLAMILAAPLAAQVRFEATADAKEMLVDGQVEVSFVLSNAQGKKFTPPDFKGFRVLSGPNQSSRTTLVNGVRSSEYGVSFILRPQQKGLLTIGSASVEVDGKTMKTKPIQISVVEGSAKPAEAHPVAFLRAEIDKNEGFPGQQILLDYKIYIQPRFFKQGHQIETMPDYAGFFTEQPNYYRSVQEVVDGVEYVSATLARLALFPQRTGDLEIPPLTILLDIGERRSNPFGIGLAPVERLRLSSNPLTIKVNPFPEEEKPESFTGACGKYSFQVDVNRTEITTDDALSLTIRIKGDGDIKQVGLPVLAGVDSFEVYEPKVFIDEMEDTGNGFFTGKKVIEYLLTPRTTGRFEVPLRFSYWDPESKTYVTADQPPLQVTVTQGSRKSSAIRGATKDKDPMDQLYPLKTGTHMQNQRHIWVRSPLFWGITVLPFLGLLGFVLYRRRQTLEERANPGAALERRVKKAVDEHLSTARAHLQSGNHSALFEEVSQALSAYLRHKLDIPPSQWTKDRVISQLESAGVRADIIAQVREVLYTCEMALYGGQASQEAAQKVFDQASRVIREMETTWLQPAGG